MNEKTSELKKVKFLRGLYVKEPVDITSGISMGNEKQEGDNLMSYVNSLNLNIQNIKSAEFIVTGHIHRYYVGEEAARKMHDDWILKNKQILSHLKMPYKITDWKDIIETSEFKTALIRVYELYEKDTSFKAKVNNVSRSHTSKADFETVKKYLLEECTYFYLYKGNFAYPSDHLNSACMHMIDNYNKDLTFRGYGLMPPKKTKKDTQPVMTSSHQQESSSKIPVAAPRTNSPPKTYIIDLEGEITPQHVFMYCGQISYLMDKIGLHGSQNKEQFFSKFVKTEEECLSMIPKKLIPTNNTGSQNDESTTQYYESLRVRYQK